MATIEGIRQTGQQIYDATEPNSVTNQIEGQAFKDIADVLEESASLGIKKTYLTNSDMQSDASPNPIGDDGNLIKNGELVSVTDDPDPNKNGIYAYVITDGVGVWRYRGPLGDVSNKADKTDASGNPVVYLPAGTLSIVSDDEYAYAIVDAENYLLWGKRWDGTTFDCDNTITDNIQHNEQYIGEVKLQLDNFITLYAGILEMTSLTDDPEWLRVWTDKEGHILAGIKTDGSFYTPEFEEIKKRIEALENTSGDIIDDPEGRLELTLDKNENIVSERQADGTKVEPKLLTENLSVTEAIRFSDKAMQALHHDLINSGFSSGTGDWSDQSLIKMPIPRICAKVNLICSKLPTSKTDDIQAILELWDMDGNYFRIPIILNAQGSSSMFYYIKNLGIDLVNQKLKFGDWVVQDSFHIKKYYIDAFRGQSNVCYNLAEQMYRTRPYGQMRPWDYLNDNTSVLNSGGTLDRDFPTGALSHPDGFPIAIYWNGNFFGLYSWNLKKHRDNYNLDGSNPDHIFLDGTLGGAQLWGGTVDWNAFEIRNPKGLIDINGNKYDGDNPTELSDSDPFSATVKANIQKLAGAVPAIRAASGNDNKRALFEEYFNLPFMIDYFVFAQAIYDFDGFAKNWLWCSWDGNKYSPCVYDKDSVFGMSWRGTFVMPESITNILGTSSVLPTGQLYQLYLPQIKERYNELRGDGVFTTGNITGLFEDWVSRVGYDNYKREFEKYPDVPSYRDPKINAEFWELVDMGNTSYAPYDNAAGYAVGDTCRDGLNVQYGFRCVKDSTGNRPFTGFYSNNPVEAGFYNSIGRVGNWLDQRFANLDSQFNN